MHSLLLKIVIDLKYVQMSKFTQSKLWIVVSYVSSYQPNVLWLEKVISLSREKNETLRSDIPKIFNICRSINNVAKQKSWWWVVSDPIFLRKLLQWDFISRLALKKVRSFLVLILGRYKLHAVWRRLNVNLIWYSSCEF